MKMPDVDLSEHNPVARITFDPLGLEFIIEHLPADDMFTDELKAVLENAKAYHWSKAL